MKLIVGLGNPGREHAGQRHNVGFMAADRIAAEYGFGPWRSRFQGLAADGLLGGEKTVLLKPQTWMNLSGQSVGEAMRYLKLSPAEVIVIHDEMDLPPGTVRLKDGGGHAGHNGLRSIHQHIGEGYKRVRIGIGHPADRGHVIGYVLSRFSGAEAETIARMIEAVADGAPLIAKWDTSRFANRLAAA